MVAQSGEGAMPHSPPPTRGSPRCRWCAPGRDPFSGDRCRRRWRGSPRRRRRVLGDRLDPRHGSSEHRSAWTPSDPRPLNLRAGPKHRFAHHPETPVRAPQRPNRPACACSVAPVKRSDRPCRSGLAEPRICLGAKLRVRRVTQTLSRRPGETDTRRTPRVHPIGWRRPWTTATRDKYPEPHWSLCIGPG